MSKIKGFPNPSRKGSLKGCRNPVLNNSNYNSNYNLNTTHLNTTQLQHQLKPRRGLEESKAKSSSSPNLKGAPRNAIWIGLVQA